MKAYSLFTDRKKYSELPKHLFIWGVLLCSFFPLYMILNISFKSNEQFFNQPWLLTFPLHLENWSQGFAQISGAILNSIYLSVTATVLTLIFGTFSAYFFARFRVPGSRFFWAMFLTLMFMPSIANLIPLFSLLRQMNLLNTFIALIVVGTSAGQVVTVYILRNFIEEIPEELFEAAQLDGASHLQQIRNIVLPMSGSILSTLAILRFIGEWNSFILPLIVLRDTNKLPIAVTLYQMEGAYVKEWGPMMAAYSIASIPLIIIFVFSMRLFIKGLSSGAIKG